jgi:hypothetical protein
MLAQREWPADWADDVEMARVAGPNGEARVFEGFRTDHEDSRVAVLIPQPDGSYRRTTIVYSVRFGGEQEDFTSLGEAYIVAGRRAGRPV